MTPHGAIPALEVPRLWQLGRSGFWKGSPARRGVWRSPPSSIGIKATSLSPLA